MEMCIRLLQLMLQCDFFVFIKVFKKSVMRLSCVDTSSIFSSSLADCHVVLNCLPILAYNLTMELPMDRYTDFYWSSSN